MRRSRTLAGALAGVLALSGSTWLVAQAPPATADYGETIEVRVVNVEVVVTDKKGDRVTGLGPQDFKLIVDGEPVPVGYFTEVRGGMAIDAAPGTEATGVPQLAPGSPVGTSYLVFVDDFFSIGRDRDRALEGMREQLGNIGPEDRMAMVAFDGSRLSMLTSWTNSTEQLDKAIRDAKARPAFGLQRLAEIRRFDQDKNRIQASMRFGTTATGGLVAPDPTRLAEEERWNADILADQTSRAVTAATAALRSFAAPPGRKVMLVLSGGWPFDPVDYIVNDRTRVIIDDASVPRGRNLLGPLSDTANLLGYTLYTVDLPGLEYDGHDASVGSLQAELALEIAEGTPASAFSRQQLTEDTLRWLAGETGGRAMINAAGQKMLSAAADDTRSYYWLGFMPQRAGNDEQHDIKVEVNLPGLKVRAREGYLDISPRTEIAMAVESGLIMGEMPNAKPLFLKLGAPVKAGMGKMRVPIEVAIPSDAIALLPGGTEGMQFHADLELRIGAIDDTGATAPVPAVPFTVSTKSAPGPGATFRYSTTLELRKRPHKLLIAVHDVTGGDIFAASGQVAPPR